MKNIQNNKKFLAVFAAAVCALVFAAAGESQAVERRKEQRDLRKADSGGVKIYAEKNYQGRSQVLREGTYRVNDLRIGNDKLSSIRVGDGYQVILYQNDNFRGGQKVVKSDLSSLGSFDNKTSSIVVKKIPQPQTQREPVRRPAPAPRSNLKTNPPAQIKR
jgi:hypothetical protein